MECHAWRIRATKNEFITCETSHLYTVTFNGTIYLATIIIIFVTNE